MHDNKIETNMIMGNLHPFCDQLISNNPEMLNSEDCSGVSRPCPSDISPAHKIMELFSGSGGRDLSCLCVCAVVHTFSKLWIHAFSTCMLWLCFCLFTSGSTECVSWRRDAENLVGVLPPFPAGHLLRAYILQKPGGSRLVTSVPYISMGFGL